MSILTVGDIIANDKFDVNCDVIITHSCDGEEILWHSYGGDDCPAEFIVKPVNYMTIRMNALVIEAKMEEE